MNEGAPKLDCKDVFPQVPYLQVSVRAHCPALKPRLVAGQTLMHTSPSAFSPATWHSFRGSDRLAASQQLPHEWRRAGQRRMVGCTPP